MEKKIVIKNKQHSVFGNPVTNLYYFETIGGFNQLRQSFDSVEATEAFLKQKQRESLETILKKIRTTSIQETT